ncbi:hypothetical protein [Marinospirillum perlucidum]|uniref:hypothetical protein n=1 Tax=Marinospirillum perlucidum TaxID=1982602 RepID=UPI000DF475E3|nr:hypothetical protein [Marinospirillum perlucidum]
MIEKREKGLLPHEAPAPMFKGYKLDGRHAGQRKTNFYQRLMSYQAEENRGQGTRVVKNNFTLY